MLKKSSSRRAGAFILALFFTTAWSLNSLHDLFLHHAHPVCATTYDGKGGTHIHDERYEAHGCTLCAMLFSAPELLSFLALPSLPSKLPETVSPNFYHSPFQSKTACDSTLRRGPPVI